MATPRETAFDGTVVPAAKKALAYLDTKLSHIAGQVWQTTVFRGGQKVPVLQEVADTKTIAIRTQGAVAELSAKVDGLVGALAAVNKGEAFDEAKLLTSIEEATRRGVGAAIENITEVTTVNFRTEEEGLQDLGEIEGAPQ